MNSHNSELSKFLLVGNGSYKNRGCEAIVRGTMNILRHHFGKNVDANIGIYTTPPLLREQIANETDERINTFLLNHTSRRWSRDWIEQKLNTSIGLNLPSLHRPITSYLQDSIAVLEIGGDTYSLDYGTPIHYLNMDSFLLSRGVPLVLWGASVGPFDQEPEFAEKMFANLKNFSAIFVRESISQAYLQKNGIESNVHLMADPAFVMMAEKPASEMIDFEILPGTIGLNFSPLIAKNFVKAEKQIWDLTEADIRPWLEFCIEIVIELEKKTDREIILIPHVTSDSIFGDDHRFLKQVSSIASKKIGKNIACLPKNLSATQIKWIIAQCSIFAGARTHSTIAALSSEVPTLSVGYSVKAKGINQDIFGHQDFCLDSKSLTLDLFIERIIEVLDQENNIRQYLHKTIPGFKEKSFGAGSLLKTAINLKN